MLFDNVRPALPLPLPPEPEQLVPPPPRYSSVPAESHDQTEVGLKITAKKKREMKRERIREEEAKETKTVDAKERKEARLQELLARSENLSEREEAELKLLAEHKIGAAEMNCRAIRRRARELAEEEHACAIKDARAEWHAREMAVEKAMHHAVCMLSGLATADGHKVKIARTGLCPASCASALVRVCVCARVRVYMHA